MEDNTYATVVITDIRNFTGLFEKHQKMKSEHFIKFLNNYYRIQYDIARIISDDTYANNTGDGVLTIFKSEKSYLEGYAFMLAIHRCLKRLCREFSDITGDNTSYGIGADSGHVWDVGKDLEDEDLDTYVGSVINRSSRMEAKTKMFGGTNAAVGHYLYNKLLEHFYPDHYEFIKDYEGQYDELLNEHQSMVLVSKEMFLVLRF
jgi:class 3 adenylate cyclase